MHLLSKGWKAKLSRHASLNTRKAKLSNKVHLLDKKKAKLSKNAYLNKGKAKLSNKVHLLDKKESEAFQRSALLKHKQSDCIF